MPITHRPQHLKTAFALALAASLAGTAQAQQRRCDLEGRDTTINNQSYKRCLDLADLNGDVVTVPQNVTRIDNDGLSLCKSSVESGGNADIVYIYDNSTSMGGGRSEQRVFVSATDTIFYFDASGCSNTGTSGTLSIQRWNAAGTALLTQNVPKLVSNAGCNHPSGDPFNARGKAFRDGIVYQHENAKQSTAGIMSFTNPSVANVVRPTQMGTTAGRDAVLAGINAVSNGGTNYRPPLDTAKRWLTTSITSNPQKAIIFLSDGSHTALDNYKAVLDTAFERSRGFGGPMPRIFGIFMGEIQPDTSNLSELSRLTGGQFFLIDPGRPQDLVAVIQDILDIIFLQFRPDNALVTNTTVGQSASAVDSTFFIPQPDGSWLMRLNDVIALQRSVNNTVTVRTVFREVNNRAPNDTQNITFTVRTTGAAASKDTVITSTQFSADCFLPSLLRIVNPGNLGELPLLTQADNAFRTRLRTSPIELASATDTARTPLKGDRESVALPRTTADAESVVFLGSHAFQVTTNPAALHNGTLQSNLYDTVIARWIHPRDLQDFTADTVLVQATQIQAEAHFAETQNGPAITSYKLSQQVVHVVIRDQEIDPRRAYTALIVTTDSRSLPDTEVVALTQLSPGVLVGQINVDYDLKNPRDGTLQVSNQGDQLKVIYVDPVYGDRDEAVAGFAQNVEKAPQLVFTDAAGATLDSGVIWSPTAGKLHFSYRDDYADNLVPNKQISVVVGSRRYGAVIGTDNETVTAAMTLAAGDTVWKGSIDLADVFPPISGNNRSETSYRGEAVITASAHNNVGVPQALTVSDNLVIAFPDSTASLSWTLADTNQVPKGSEGLIITVRDQSFTSAANDSVAVSVICAGTGDSVSGVAARESADGSYVTGIIVKNEGAPNPGDRVLTCLSADQIRIVYVDPVYGTGAEITVNETAAPVARPPGGPFTTSRSVELTSATPGAIIYYTLDGSQPIPGQSQVYTGPIEIIGTSTLKAVAVRDGFKNSKVITEVYTKEFTASRLEILDENGNQIPEGFLTGATKSFRVKVTTTQAGLSGVVPHSITKTAGDAEGIALNNLTSLGNAFEYFDNYALNYGLVTRTASDTIDARGTDTLIVTWTNPLDSRDVARDTIVIKPPFVAARVYFTAGLSPTDTVQISQYPAAADSIYIVVKTRPRDPTLVYSVNVTTSSLGDVETLVLTELNPGSGVFFAKAPVGKASRTLSDGTVDVQVTGDQLTAVFVDPVYKDSYRGNAGFNAEVEETPQIDFVTAAGAPVAPLAVWSPAAGKVYLRFSDDWNAQMPAALQTKTAQLSLRILRSGAEIGRDTETMTLSLNLAGVTGTRGTWLGEMILEDKLPPAADNKLQTGYRGELEATVTPHTKGGVASSPAVKDSLLIAHQNQPPEIIIRDTSGAQVDRPTTKVEVIIKDQPVASGTPTITATVACLQTGDKILNVTLVWNGTDGYVVQPPIEKVEGGTVNLSDLRLTCAATDVIQVTYTDPVYGDPANKEVGWVDDKAPNIYFTSVRDGSVITSANEAVDSTFNVVVEGRNARRDVRDTIEVTLSTNEQVPADQVKVKAVETGPMTGIYVATVTFGFTTANPSASNDRLELRLNASSRTNRVLVTAKATVNGAERSADIALFSAFNIVSKAYIKDLDGDGRGDHVYFVFDRKLSRLPGSLEEVYWNDPSVPADKRQATSGQISFVGTDSTVVVVDFSKDEFPPNLTDIPEGKVPYGKFPNDNLFGGQMPAIADSMGPVIISAELKSNNGVSYDYSPTEKRFPPDTLFITLSEPIKTSQSFNDLLGFVVDCQSGLVPRPVKTFSEPTTSDGLTYVVIVDNSGLSELPSKGDCIYLETDGRYTDLKENRPPLLGVPLVEKTPRLAIRIMRGYPPVAGMDASNSGFVIANNNRCDEDGNCTWTKDTPQGTGMVWIPPVGFDASDPDWMTKVERESAKETGRTAERRPREVLPAGVSTVLVISTAAYRADISIFDHIGNFLRSSTQYFGRNGEMANPQRTDPGLAEGKGRVSYLVWDMKTKKGQLAGQGVYVWKVNFTYFEGNARRSEIKYIRTGVVRK